MTQKSVVNCRLDDQLIDDLKNEAELQGLTFTDVVTEALRRRGHASGQDARIAELEDKLRRSEDAYYAVTHKRAADDVRMTITTRPEIRARIKATAAARGLSPSQAVTRVLQSAIDGQSLKAEAPALEAVADARR